MRCAYCGGQKETIRCERCGVEEGGDLVQLVEMNEEEAQRWREVAEAIKDKRQRQKTALFLIVLIWAILCCALGVNEPPGVAFTISLGVTFLFVAPLVLLLVFCCDE